MGAEESYKKLLIKQNVPVVVGGEIKKGPLSVPNQSSLNLTELDSMKEEAFSPREASQRKQK